VKGKPAQDHVSRMIAEFDRFASIAVNWS
jgi:hypothetical protein